MSGYALRLLEDRLASGGDSAVSLPPQIRCVYVLVGRVTVSFDGQTTTVAGNGAWFGAGPCSIRGGAEGATLWRWELVRTPPSDDGLASGAAVESALKQSEELHLDPKGRYMMRCDRVDFPLGGIAYTHIHWGPGLRCLLRGELKVRTEEREWVVRPGETWFERGPDPVYAEASSTEETSFIRAMALPRAIRGQTSIRYLREEDQDKPKTQRYTRFVDELVEL